MKKEINTFVRNNAIYLLKIGYDIPMLTEDSFIFNVSSERYKGKVEISYNVVPLIVRFHSSNVTKEANNMNEVVSVLLEVIGKGKSGILFP